MSYLVLRPEYPHENMSNARLSIRKGQVISCPEGYTPSQSTFLVFDSFEAALKAANAITKQSQSQSWSQPQTPTQSQPQPLSRPQKLVDRPIHPLLRRVRTPDGSIVETVLPRDVHQFLARPEADVINDIRAMPNLANAARERLLRYERFHFHRDNVIAALTPAEQSESENEREGDHEGEGREKVRGKEMARAGASENREGGKRNNRKGTESTEGKGITSSRLLPKLSNPSSGSSSRRLHP